MPYGDGIDRKNCFSLSDFNTFEYCPFRFYVTHHLQKKYEIEEGNEAAALGSILDLVIKKFHRNNFYGASPENFIGLIRLACNEMRTKASKASGPSFYSGLTKYLTDDLCLRADEIFRNYYEKRGRKIFKSLGEVEFCEWIMELQDGQKYKLWGWPDTYELADDGVAEIVDYKSREALAFNPELGDSSLDVTQDYKSRDLLEKASRVKQNMDMDLMPKIYALLASNDLLKKGHKKARFRVRIWQDPLEESLYEEFDLEAISGAEFLFKQKIQKIVENREIKFCEKPFCKACNSEKRKDFMKELNKLGIGEEIFEELGVEPIDFDLDPSLAFQK